MRLFLKKDNSMTHSRFIVKDSGENDKYVVTGKYGDAIQKLAVSSLDGEVLLKIRLLISRIFSTFVVSGTDKRIHITAIKKDRIHEFRFYGIDWYLRSDIDFRTFEIYDSGGTLIMSQKSDSYSSKGYYTLDITSPDKELLCIAVALCMDVYNFADSVAVATV